MSLTLILKPYVNEIAWVKEEAQKRALDLFLMVLFLNKFLGSHHTCITNEVKLLDCLNIFNIIATDIVLFSVAHIHPAQSFVYLWVL